MTLLQQILLQVVLILLNAFFAATEIAVISLNRNKLEKMAEDGDRKAPKLLKLTENQSAFLSTIQIGITLAGFLGSAFAADNIAGYFIPIFMWLLPVGICSLLLQIYVSLLFCRSILCGQVVRCVMCLSAAG